MHSTWQKFGQNVHQNYLTCNVVLRPHAEEGKTERMDVDTMKSELVYTINKKIAVVLGLAGFWAALPFFFFFYPNPHFSTPCQDALRVNKSIMKCELAPHVNTKTSTPTAL